MAIYKKLVLGIIPNTNFVYSLRLRVLSQSFFVDKYFQNCKCFSKKTLAIIPISLIEIGKRRKDYGTYIEVGTGEKILWRKWK